MRRTRGHGRMSLYNGSNSLPPLYSYSLQWNTADPPIKRQSSFSHILNLAWPQDLSWPTEYDRGDIAPVPSVDRKRPCVFPLPLRILSPREQAQTCLMNDETWASVTLHHLAESQPTARNVRSHPTPASPQPSCQVTTDVSDPNEISSAEMSLV